jgi:pseudouridine-5'-phosphate glycosidase
VTYDWLVISDEVQAALTSGRPVVALESSLVAQGLPTPHNLETADAAEAAVRDRGAVPAATAIADGRVVVGASRSLLERLADPATQPAKAGSRDIGPSLAAGRWHRPRSAPPFGSPTPPASRWWRPAASAASTAVPSGRST